MIRFLLLVKFIGLCSMAPALAGDEFRIKSLRETRSTDLILVNRSWIKDPKRLMATLRVETETPATGINVVAYFFDKDGKEVAKVGKPNPIWTRTPRGVEEVGLPATFEKGKDIDVYFALTTELEAKKWKSLVVIFGNDKAVAARSLPASAIATLSFPEKDRMLKEEK